MAQGAAQANAALKSVGDQAKVAEDATKKVGSSLSNAFQATGGTLQVAQGITQIGTAFQQMNIAAAGGGISRTLLEIGKTASDFRALAGGIGGATSALAVMRGVLAAHPILVIATVIGLASSAMSLFASKTDEATENIKRQETALDGMLKRLDEINLRSRLGENDPRKTIRGTVDTLVALNTSDAKTISARTAANLFGVDENEIRAKIGAAGVGERALEFAPFDPTRQRFSSQQRFAVDQFNREDVIAAGERLLEQRRQSEIDAAKVPFGPALPPGFSDTRNTELNGSLLPNGGFKFNIDEQLAREQEDNARQLQQEFEELQRTARGVGETLGDGIADAIIQARSLKDVVNSLAQDLARTLIRQSVGNLATSLVSSFGQTAAQQGPPGTAGTAGLTPGQS